MDEEKRPQPDELLKSIEAEEVKNRRGKLYIFLGMSAGVGKTYAMLEMAHKNIKEGIDVIIGIIETHQRPETEALLKGLSIVPRKKISYRGNTFEEMDLDAILTRKPTIVLVDELAHTNIPGSRHQKRWNDVVELLDAGINVYTTLNIQHLESRKEDIELMTGIQIRETVPDPILEQANQIELIDITPIDLIQRLKEGKVYVGDIAKVALENFFQVDMLTVLRQILFKVASEKVNADISDVKTIQEIHNLWHASDQLMVAMSQSPTSKSLIRSARRIAFNLNTSWCAVYINTGLSLTDKEKECLEDTIALARDLGAEVIVAADTDIVSALSQIARRKGVSQIIIGRPKPKSILDIIRGKKTFLERLLEEIEGIDIHILSEKKPSNDKQKAGIIRSLNHYHSSGKTIASVAGIMVVVAGISSMLLSYIGYQSVGFLFLVAVLIISLFASPLLIFAAAAISAFIWNFFFIPPIGTIRITKPEDLIMCVAYATTAVITGILTYRLQQQKRLIRMRETHNAALYEISAIIASAQDRTSCIKNIKEKLQILLGGIITVIVKQETGIIENNNGDDKKNLLDEKEWAVAQWVFDKRKPAGWTTDTLASAAALYVPLNAKEEIVGVFAYSPENRSRQLSFEEENFLTAVTRHIALYLENERKSKSIA